MVYFVRSIVVLGTLLAAVPAYAASPLLWLDQGVDLSGRQFHVAPVTAVDRAAEDEGATRILHEKLSGELAALGLLASATGDGTRRVIVTATIMKYAQGSVAGRWVQTPEGAAHIIVRVMLLDAESRALLGDMVSVQEVSSGGLFSIGAEKTVISDAAKEIARGITERLKPAR